MDRDELLRVFRAFEVHRLEYVLIGATAMGLHGLIRATEDVDLVIKAAPDNVERLRAALRDAYPGDHNIDEISTEDLLGDYPTVRYYPPSGDLYLDVIVHLGEAASFENIESQVVELDGIRVTVATPPAPRSRTMSEMGVRKFRSIEEMSAWQEAHRLETPLASFDRLIRHCRRFIRRRNRFEPGVRKFRSIEEAQAARLASRS